MRTYVLIPGAGGAAWYWSRVADRLRAAGSEVIAVDLPGADPDAGLETYAGLVLRAIRSRDAAGGGSVHLVAQSLGGFTAPLVAQQTPLASLVLVNAMIPVPGEAPGEWGAAVGADEAREEAARAGGYGPMDLTTYFLHDVPAEVAAEAADHEGPESEAVFASRCDFTSWPDVPIAVLTGQHDRLFPVDFQRAIARRRLGIDADVLPGGHLIALSQPDLVAAYLLEH